MTDFEVTSELITYFGLMTYSDTNLKPIELTVSSNTGQVEPLEMADGQILYIKPGKDKIVKFDFRDCSYHLLDCRCNLCQPL